MEESKVSILIPFINLNAYVLESIRGCLQLEYSNFELILLPDVPISLPTDIKDSRIKVIVTGKQIISVKRNIGITHAAAEYLAWIDSDAYPVSGWLTYAINAFHKFGENVWAVGGPNITPPNEKLRQRAVGYAMRSFLVSGGRAFRKSIAKDRFVNDLPTCNLITRRDVFTTLGLFNEKLITGEDIELCNRIRAHHKNIFYHSKVVVYHHNRDLIKPYLLQRITYGYSVFRVFKQHPSVGNLFLFIPLVFVLFTFIAPLSGSWSVYQVWTGVLTLYALAIVSESIRYSSSLAAIPLTSLAILIGNFAPGIGSLIALFGIPLNIRKIYQNFDGARA